MKESWSKGKGEPQRKDKHCGVWRTEDEVKYLNAIGRDGLSKLPRSLRLRNYIAGMALRLRWPQQVNVGLVRDHAERLHRIAVEDEAKEL